MHNLQRYRGTVLDDATIPELPNHYSGKVRDNYDLKDGRRIIIATDRLSAFDVVLAWIPLKGQVLTQTARYWFEATADICPNHVLGYPDPNVVVARRVDILPVEIIVRDYLTGSTATSILPLYKSGRREMYGARLPEGLRDNQKLPKTIITPTTKAGQGDHDMPLTPDLILQNKLMTGAQWERVSNHALALFARGREMAAKRGLILVDTKYEFGVDGEGDIVLADEIHTPDSSRFWLHESYERNFVAGTRPDSFDKDFVRSWVVSHCDPYKDPIPKIPEEFILRTAEIYVQAYESITGQDFVLPDPNELPLDRIRRNLAGYFTSA
jgi:phosphoribosylaminoimidazole-succinocarboxamide synthase